MFLELSLKSIVFFSQKLLLLVDLCKYYLAEVCPQFFGATGLVHLHKFFYFFTEISSETLIVWGYLYIFFLQVDELFIDGFEAIFKFINFGFVSIEKRDECELILMEDGVWSDSIIELIVLSSWVNIELGV